MAVLLALAGVGSGAEPPAERKTLDDFERPSDRYGELRYIGLGPSTGEVRWRRERCERSGAEGHCLRIDYDFGAAKGEEIGFAIDLRGLDASAYDHLELWIRGDAASGFDPVVRVGFRRPKPGSEMLETGLDVVRPVTRRWKRILVPLNRLSGIADWTNLKTFFLSLAARQAEVRRGTYYVDDVAFVKTGRPGPSVLDEVVPRKKRAWVKSVGGDAEAQRRVRERLSGWPTRLLVDRESLPADDHALVRRLAQDTWRGLDALTDRENGLPLDHVELSETSLQPPESRIGDYTNVTNVGLYLVAVVAARELGFLSADEAIARVRRILDTLGRLETFRGFFFNYYDTTTLERTSNFLSFVDSGWLTAGLIVVRRAMPELREEATRLIDAGDYGFFYDEVKQQMSHGYYVNVPVRSQYHYGLLYTEARIGSLIAIGKGDAPEEHWFRLSRTLRPEAVWQSQTPRGRTVKTVRGHRFRGGTYEWRGHPYAPSWGGSMFEALMPLLVLDERRHAPKSLGRNAETHATIQRLYALEVLGYPVWGLSPAAVPGDGAYGEYGVKVLGTAGYPGGAVAPYAAALALGVTPEAAVANLRKLAELYDSYGEYGFYDAVDPRSGETAWQYLALDQSMTLVASANFLKDGCIQRYFEADPIVARALPVIGAEDFLE